MGRTDWMSRLTGLLRSRTSERARAMRTTGAVPRPSPEPRPVPGASGGEPSSPGGRAAYAGDYSGVPDLSYEPRDDGDADPGEVVWAWVPYEEDHGQGKDRPVLVIGRDGRHLLGLPFTSKDHDRDKDQEARAGRYWFDVGTGAWDSSGRPSEVRLDRIIRLDPTAVRREGATLDRARFDAVAAAVRAAGGGRSRGEPTPDRRNRT